MEKTDILSLTLPELELEMIKLGEKKFRAKQIFQWLHVKQIRDFSGITHKNQWAFLFKITKYGKKA